LPCKGTTGTPVFPCRCTGEPQSADGAARNTPPQPFRLRLLHGTRETAGGMGRRVGRRPGSPQRNAEALRQSRMGQSSLNTGKPCTPGGELRAKAPSLWEEKAKEETANQGPSERASCTLLGGYAGERGSSTEEGICACGRNGTGRFIVLAMEMDQRCCAVCDASRTHGAQRGA